MEITVLGATGLVGSATVAEAQRRGHRVVAASRSTGVDATNPDTVRRVTAGSEVVITATRPTPGREQELVATTRGILTALRGTRTRLLVVGGAGTLRTAGGTLLQDAPDFPPAWRPIAQACAAQLALCTAESEVDWTYLSPAALLVEGPRTGHYRTGKDDLLIDAAGTSRITAADLAVALLDEAEDPQHRRTRFTVAY